MNTSMNTRRIWAAVLAVGLMMAGLAVRTDAADGSWTNKATSSTWTNTANWAGGIVADGASSTAWFTNDINPSITITINTAQKNAILNVGDASGSQTFTFVPASGGTLTFDNGGGTAQFNQTATAGAQTFGVPVVLASPLAISNASASGLTFTNGITGTGNLTLNANAAGGIALSTVPVNNSGAITNSGNGAGTVTISGGVGTNVTAIVQAQTGADLTISTLPLMVNIGGTTLVNTNSSGTKQLKVLAGGNVSVGGTGDLVLQNNSAIADGVNIGANVAVTNIGMLINSGTGPSNTTVYGGIGTNVIKVVQNSTNSALRLQGSHTFTNGLWIKAGTLSGENGNFGSTNGVITIGNTNGSADATLELRATLVNLYSPIMVSSGNTGVATIYFASPYTYGGPVTLSNHNLTVSSSGSTVVSLTNGITGVGDLTFKYNGTTAGTMLKFATVAPNHNGRIINAGSGPGEARIETCGVESNVTAIIENSTNSPLTIYAGVLRVNSGGTTLANLNSSGSALLTVATNSGSVAGTGDLILSNNSSIANGIWVQGTVTNIGQVINRGSGSGDVLISGVIGANVTGVRQDSAFSRLVLTNANTYGGTTVVTNGALKVDGSLSISNAVLVYTNGILQGSGTIGGTNTVYVGGMLSPGPETTAGGTLTISNLVWSDGGIYKCQVANLSGVAGIGYDQIVATTFTNAPGQKFILRMDSMGQTLIFDPNQNYGLKVLSCGTTCTLNSADITLDTNAFWRSAADADTWYVTNLNNSIYVNYRATGLAGKNYWRCPTNNGLWSAAANWSKGTVPQPGEDVEFDSLASLNCTVDVASNNLGSLTLNSTYGGTVTVATVYQPTGFTNFSIAGNCTLNGGVLTHRANSGGETNRLRMTVGGNLLVTNATILADALGYSTGNGPGTPANVTYGGCYGGGARGDTITRHIPDNSGITAATQTYGSVTAPVNLGSRAGTFGAESGNWYGGGAIWLTVQGTTTVANAGIISANAGSGNPGGSGGSVYLTTGRLEGNGTIRANGGSATSTSGSGSGGRVAIVLTGSGADFGSWNGTNTAFGGTGGKSAAAGTVYLEAPGTNTLIVDNNNTAVYGGQLATLMPAGVNLNTFSNIVVRNKGVLGIRSDTAFDFGRGNLTTYGPTNSFIAMHDATNTTYPSDWTIDGYRLYINTQTNKLANLIIGTNGVLSHFCNASPALYRLNLALSGNLTVLSNGAINVDSLGYPESSGPGNPAMVTYGGAHGGWARGDGRARVTGSYVNPFTYGAILAPIQPGSGGVSAGSPFGVGGGAIQLTVAGTSTVAAAGIVSANGDNGANGGGAGGSVYLSTGWLTGGGTIRANGGTATGAGTGGRVAIVLTGTGADFTTWTGTNSAFAGASTYPAAAGTVYRQAKADLAGAGTVLVNNNNVATNETLTPIPAFTNSTENISNTVWVTTNAVRLGLVTNATIAGLVLNANGSLELAGMTLNVKALTVTNKVYKSGIYTSSDITALKDAVGGGKVVVQAAQGTIFMLR